MVVPEPSVKLEGHCSVIHDNILYAYSEKGFASLPLTHNATWIDLKSGVPVSGAACVTGAMSPNNGQQALYVVGGSGSDDDYTGLQRYVFDEKKWETITPTSKDMANRTNHGAVFLQASASIFVYAGNRDGSSTPTSDTFVINTGSPNNVSSYSGADASPASAPVLLPWSDDRAALVGGSTTSKKVHLFKFNGTGEWSDSGSSLPQALPAGARCGIINSDDGSKILESFEMTSSPNKVQSYALVTPGGKSADPAKVVGASRKKRRRANLNNYPAYDGQYAASKTWSQYSLAQDVNGKLVAISGGSGRNSLALFNQTSNGWVNATKFFYGDESMQQILPSPSPSNTASPTSSSTPSSSASPAAGGGGGGGDASKVGTIVGATLGSVAGVALILIALLFLLKSKRNRRNGGHGGPNDKNRLSIQDQGEPLTQSAYPMAKSRAPTSSMDSLAIFEGKLSNEKKTQAAPAVHPVYGRKGPPGGAKASPLSTVQSSRELLSGGYTPDTDKAFEAAATSDEMNRPGDRRTNEGWSKYFQDNNATDFASVQPEQQPQPQPQEQQQQQQQPPADVSLAKSERRGSAWPMTDLTPLNFGFLDQPKPLGRVVTGSPTTEHSPSAADGRALVIPEGQSARISSGDSVSLVSDDNETEDGDYDRSRWTDVQHYDDNGYSRRPISSMYSQSYQNSSARDMSMLSHGQGQAGAGTMASGGSGIYSTMRSSQPRRSSVIIPDTLDEGGPGKSHSDMSWLNLNADR